MLALNGTVVVPAPMSCCGVDMAPLMELLEEYWNQTWVSLPFGSTVPGKMALLEVIALAGEEVVTVGAWELPVPVPLRGTLCGLPDALSATLRVALCAPACVGLNVTETAQLAPTVKLVGQGLVRLKPPALFLRLICVICSVAVPVFVNVTD